MSDDDSAQALAVQLRLLEEYYQDLASRESILMRLYREDKSSLTSMTALRDAKSADLLVPIGGGAHLPVTYAGGGKVVVDVGSGVAIEKTAEEIEGPAGCVEPGARAGAGDAADEVPEAAFFVGRYEYLPRPHESRSAPHAVERHR